MKNSLQTISAGLFFNYAAQRYYSRSITREVRKMCDIAYIHITYVRCERNRGGENSNTVLYAQERTGQNDTRRRYILRPYPMSRDKRDETEAEARDPPTTKRLTPRMATSLFTCYRLLHERPPIVRDSRSGT